MEKLEASQREHASVINILAEEIDMLKMLPPPPSRNGSGFRTGLVFENHHRHGLVASMRQGQRDIADAELFRDFSGFSVKGQRRTAGGKIGHFEIAPPDASAPSGAQRFHPGFLGGEARGVALIPIRFALRVGDFAIGEDAVLETLAMALDRFAEPADFAQIHARADDHSSAPVVVMVRRPCLTPLVEMSASAIFRTADALPLSTITSRQWS